MQTHSSANRTLYAQIFYDKLKPQSTSATVIFLSRTRKEATALKDRSVYIFEWSPRTHIDPFHTHDHLEIGYCLSGTGTFYFGEKQYTAEPGDLFVINNMERHAASSDPRNPSNYFFIYFDAMIIEQADPKLLLPFVYYPQQFENRIDGSLPVAARIGALFAKYGTRIGRSKAVTKG